MEFTRWVLSVWGIPLVEYGIKPLVSRTFGENRCLLLDTWCVNIKYTIRVLQVEDKITRISITVNIISQQKFICIIIVNQSPYYSLINFKWNVYQIINIIVHSWQILTWLEGKEIVVEYFDWLFIIPPITPVSLFSINCFFIN